MSEWTQAIWSAVSAMTAALVLSLAAGLGQLAQYSARIQQEEDNNIAIVQEYRRYNQYEGTQVYPQDVISVIADGRGQPAIWVDIIDGPGENFSWKWDTTTEPEKFSPNYLSGVFPLGGTYHSSLVKGLNGEIIRLEFRRD